MGRAAGALLGSLTLLLGVSVALAQTAPRLQDTLTVEQRAEFEVAHRDLYREVVASLAARWYGVRLTRVELERAWKDSYYAIAYEYEQQGIGTVCPECAQCTTVVCGESCYAPESLPFELKLKLEALTSCETDLDATAQANITLGEENDALRARVAELEALLQTEQTDLCAQVDTDGDGTVNVLEFGVMKGKLDACMGR